MKLSTNNYQLSTRQEGFTLFEAIVATAVFAFVISSILGVYVATIQLDTKTRSQRAVAQNGRFIVEYLAKAIRNGTIDYASYSGGTASSQTELYIKNQSNESERIFVSGSNLMLTKIEGTTALNSSSVLVSNARFYVIPETDPLTAQRPPPQNQQPTVTVILELTSNYGKRPNDLVKMNMQTTFTIRAYPSRLP